MKGIRTMCVVLAVASAAGCGGHPSGPTAPTESRALALFDQAFAAAKQHDAKALCATASYSLQCQQDLAARPFPDLRDVRTAGVRLVDNSRVVRVCGTADGQRFASDFPVTQEPPDRHLVSDNPVFWTPIQFVAKPAKSVAVGAPTSPPSEEC